MNKYVEALALGKATFEGELTAAFVKYNETVLAVTNMVILVSGAIVQGKEKILDICCHTSQNPEVVTYCKERRAPVTSANGACFKYGGVYGRRWVMSLGGAPNYKKLPVRELFEIKLSENGEFIYLTYGDESHVTETVEGLDEKLIEMLSSKHIVAILADVTAALETAV